MSFTAILLGLLVFFVNVNLGGCTTIKSRGLNDRTSVEVQKPTQPVQTQTRVLKENLSPEQMTQVPKKADVKEEYLLKHPAFTVTSKQTQTEPKKLKGPVILQKKVQVAKSKSKSKPEPASQKITPVLATTAPVAVAEDGLALKVHALTEQRNQAWDELRLLRPKAEEAERALDKVKVAQAEVDSMKKRETYGFYVLGIACVIIMVLAILPSTNFRKNNRIVSEYSREVGLLRQQNEALQEQLVLYDHTPISSLKEKQLTTQERLALCKKGDEFVFTFTDPVSRQELSGEFVVERRDAEITELLCRHCGGNNKKVIVFATPPKFETLRSHVRKDNGISRPVLKSA